MKRNRLIATALLLCLVAGVSGWAWAQNRPQRDPLAGLKHALTQAGAPALNADQETKLNALITQFRTQNANTNRTPPLNQSDLENAILNGDSAAASALIGAAANQIAANTTARLKARADFAIQVIQILRTNGDQVGALQKFIGSRGLVRLAESLAGGGRRGPGGGMPEGQGMQMRMRR